MVTRALRPQDFADIALNVFFLTEKLSCKANKV